MKNIFLVTLITVLGIVKPAYAQTDSTKTINKSYKRNIQGLLLGSISLYYEQAFTKHTSIKFRVGYSPLGHQPFRKSVETPLSILFSTQFRYYLNKNKSYNEGFYLNGAVLFLYNHSFEDCYYEPYINKIYIRDNGYRPYLASDQYDVYYETIHAGAGLGFGYQWIFEKRFTMDLGIAMCYPVINIERFRHTEYNQEWREIIYGESESWWYKYGQYNVDVNFAVGFNF
jgi:hypothetical protein